jgi:hypothetical protein
MFNLLGHGIKMVRTKVWVEAGTSGVLPVAHGAAVPRAVKADSNNALTKSRLIYE